MIKKLYWVLLILGTVIGAGYASGREIWLFFGPNSGLAIVSFTILFGLSNYSILLISYQKRSKNYKPILTNLLTPKINKFYDRITFIYLIMTIIIMISGSGALLEVFELPKWFGILFIVIMLAWIFSYNLNQLLDINSIIVPALLLGLMIILTIFLKNNSNVSTTAIGGPNYFNAALFTSVNLLPIVSVVGAFGYKLTSKKEVVFTSVCSAVLLGTISWIYNHSLTLIEFNIENYEMPVYAILERFPVIAVIVMTFIIWLAIFLTALAAMIGVISRLQSRFSLSRFKIAFFLMVSLIPFSFVGFQALVESIYPVYGIINLYLLVKLVAYPFTDSKT